MPAACRGTCQEAASPKSIVISLEITLTSKSNHPSCWSPGALRFVQLSAALALADHPGLSRRCELRSWGRPQALVTSPDQRDCVRTQHARLASRELPGALGGLKSPSAGSERSRAPPAGVARELCPTGAGCGAAATRAWALPDPRLLRWLRRSDWCCSKRTRRGERSAAEEPGPAEGLPSLLLPKLEPRAERWERASHADTG